MATELEVLESLVGGYQRAVSVNSRGFNRFKTMLNVALGFIVAAPLSGATMLLLEAAAPISTRL